MGSTDAQSGQGRYAPEARTEALPLPDKMAVQVSINVSGSPLSAPPAVDFAAEYQRAYRVLWVVAAGVLGRAAGAEDVVQEAALLGLKKIREFEPGTHFTAWMAQMVRFVALNHLRKHLRGRAAALDEKHATTLPQRGEARDKNLQLGSRGELPAGQHSFDDELIGALGTLTDVARACLLLRTVEGLDYVEIGQVLGIPDGTAMSHVHRSRMRLREQLTRAKATNPEATNSQQANGIRQ